MKLHFTDAITAEKYVTPYYDKPWKPGDGVVFHGSVGWIGNINDGFQASDRRLWATELKESDEHLPVSKEHNKNFVDCVLSREETMCPAEMAIRCDAICHLARAAALTGKPVTWDPVEEKVVGNELAAVLMGPQAHRPEWKIW